MVTMFIRQSGKQWVSYRSKVLWGKENLMIMIHFRKFWEIGWDLDMTGHGLPERETESSGRKHLEVEPSLA
jgi:hypothetical protein